MENDLDWWEYPEILDGCIAYEKALGSYEKLRASDDADDCRTEEARRGAIRAVALMSDMAIAHCTSGNRARVVMALEE